MEKKIDVIVKTAYGRCEQKTILNDLHRFQKLVGGNIEVLELAPDLAVIVDEEGLLKPRRYNCNVRISNFFITCEQELYGTAVFVGIDGENFTHCPYSAGDIERLFIV